MGRNHGPGGALDCLIHRRRRSAEQAYAMLEVGGTATVIGMIPLGQTVEIQGEKTL